MATITGDSGPNDLSSSTSAMWILAWVARTHVSRRSRITLDGGADNDQLFSSGGATLIAVGRRFMKSNGHEAYRILCERPAGYRGLSDGFCARR